MTFENETKLPSYVSQIIVAFVTNLWFSQSFRPFHDLSDQFRYNMPFVKTVNLIIIVWQARAVGEMDRKAKLMWGLKSLVITLCDFARIGIKVVEETRSEMNFGGF